LDDFEKKYRAARAAALRIPCAVSSELIFFNEKR
jgi:hypothetical protein